MKKNCENKSSYTYRICLGLLLFLPVIGLVIYVYPQSTYSYLPASWDVYFTYAFCNHPGFSHLSDFSRLNTCGYTSGISMAPSINQGYVAYHMLIVQVLGFDQTAYLVFLRYFLFIPLIVWPLMCILIYVHVSQRNNKAISTPFLVLLSCFALFGNDALISSSSFTVMADNIAFSWVSLVLGFYFLLGREEDRRCLILFIIVVVSMATYYTTASQFFLIMFFVMAVARLLPKRLLQKVHLFAVSKPEGSISEKKSEIYLPLLFIATGLILIWGLGVSFAFSTEIGMMQSWLYGGGLNNLLLLEPYMLKSSLTLQAIRTGLRFLTLLPLLHMFFLSFLKKRLHFFDNWTSNFVLALVFVLISSALFALAFGTLGLSIQQTLNRFFTNPICICAMGLTVFLSVGNKTRVFKGLVALIIIVMISSVYVSLAYNSPAAGRLTYQESNSVVFLSNLIPYPKVIFTDGRIGTSFAMFNHHNVTGASTTYNERPPYEFVYSVSAVYYDINATRALQHIQNSQLNNESPSFALFSMGMTNIETGVSGSQLRFKAAPENFIEKFYSTSEMNLIYDNNEVRIFNLR